MTYLRTAAACLLLVALLSPASAETPTPSTQPAPLTAIAPPGHPYARLPMRPAKILTLPADQAFTELMVTLATGDQRHVESTLPTLIEHFDKDQPLLFFYAVCTRSRFEVEDAAPLFLAVQALDPHTPEAHCAALMLKIDNNQQPAEYLFDLVQLAHAHPDKLLIQWCAAIGCRTLDVDTSGCQLYHDIFAAFAPAVGPALMHQTYANLLDNTQHYEEALAHRHIVVEMEPAGWSYQGLANTLNSMKHFDEADKAYAQATTLDPSSSLFWQTWGNSLIDAGRFTDAEVKLERAIRLDSRNSIALFDWGVALESEGNLDQALVKYREAIEANPRAIWAYRRAAHVLTALGRQDEADAITLDSQHVNAFPVQR